MLKSGRRKDRRRGAKTQLQMTSMMDILTVLLLFLLKSFVAEGEVITPVPGVELPDSSSDSPPSPALVVAVFDDTIMLDGRVVGRISVAKTGPSLYIDDLGTVLRQARDQERDLARRRGAEAGPGRVAIQGDRGIDFAILERVMHTCNQAGFADISLAVLGAS